MENNGKILYIVFFAIIILIRILGLALNIYADEAIFSLEARDGFANFSNLVSVHPPLSTFFYSLYGSLFGDSNIAIRLVPFTFSLLILIIVYLIAKNLYNKDVAVVSVFLMAISFWQSVASLQIDIDGAILPFMMVSTFFCYVKYEQSNKKKWLFGTGISFGLCLLTKLPGILIIPILLMYGVLSKKSILTHKSFSHKNFCGFLYPSQKSPLKTFLVQDIKKMVKSIALIIFLGTAIFFSVFLFYYVIGFDFFIPVFAHGSSSVRFMPSFIPFVYLLIWGTPLLVFTPLLCIKDYKKEHPPLRISEILLLSWCIIPIIFYLFVGTPYVSPFDRYLMILIPPLCILAGKYLSDNFNKRLLLLTGTVILLTFIMVLILNLTTSYLSHDINKYFSNMLTLNWGFYFPITGSSGPVFGMNFASIALIYIISGIFALLSLLGKYRVFFFHIFIGIVIGFNLFMIVEMIFHIAHPDFNKAITDVSGYFLENKLQPPVYTNQLSYLYYLNLVDGDDFSTRRSDKYFWFTFNSDEKRLNELEDMINTKKGTILITDFPIINKNSRLWQIINKCSVRKIFYSKNFPVGYVFEC